MWVGKSEQELEELKLSTLEGSLCGSTFLMEVRLPPPNRESPNTSKTVVHIPTNINQAVASRVHNSHLRKGQGLSLACDL